MKPQLNHIQTLIHQGDLPNAINQLLQFTKNSNYHDEIILHSANLKQLQKNTRQGILSFEDIRRERTRLTRALLEIIKELDTNLTRLSNENQQNTDLLDIIKILASKPTHIEAETMNYSYDSSKNITIRDINNSGVLNLGEIIGDVNNTINQIPESQDSKNKELKTLLQELNTAIETENSLDNDEKVEAANQVKKIAEASQEPENESLQIKAKRAVSVLEIIAKGLEPASKLAKACQKTLPIIINFLGL